MSDSLFGAEAFAFEAARAAIMLALGISEFPVPESWSLQGFYNSTVPSNIRQSFQFSFMFLERGHIEGGLNVERHSANPGDKALHATRWNRGDGWLSKDREVFNFEFQIGDSDARLTVTQTE